MTPHARIRCVGGPLRLQALVVCALALLQVSSARADDAKKSDWALLASPSAIAAMQFSNDYVFGVASLAAGVRFKQLVDVELFIETLRYDGLRLPGALHLDPDRSAAGVAAGLEFGVSDNIGDFHVGVHVRAGRAGFDAHDSSGASSIDLSGYTAALLGTIGYAFPHEKGVAGENDVWIGAVFGYSSVLLNDISTSSGMVSWTKVDPALMFGLAFEVAFNVPRLSSSASAPTFPEPQKTR